MAAEESANGVQDETSTSAISSAENELKRAKKLLNMAKIHTSNLKSQLNEANEKIKSLQELEEKNKRLIEIAKTQQEQINLLNSNLKESELTLKSNQLEITKLKEEKLSIQTNLSSSSNSAILKLNENDEKLIKILYRLKVEKDIFCLTKLRSSYNWYLESNLISSLSKHKLSNLQLPALNELNQQIFKFISSEKLNAEIKQLKIEFKVERNKKEEEIEILKQQKARLQLLFQNRQKPKIINNSDNYKNNINSDKNVKIKIKEKLNLKEEERKRKEKVQENQIKNLEKIIYDLEINLKTKIDEYEKLKIEFYSCLKVISNFLSPSKIKTGRENQSKNVSKEELVTVREEVIKLLMMNQSKSKSSSFFK